MKFKKVNFTPPASTKNYKLEVGDIVEVIRLAYNSEPKGTRLTIIKRFAGPRYWTDGARYYYEIRLKR